MQARALAVFGLVALAAAAIGAQQPAPHAQGEPTPVFRAGTELVRLDVRVVDADGRPIPDLRREEIEVLEDGRPRPIVVFQRVHEMREAPAAAQARSVTRDISSNQGAPRGHLYVLVFDQQHISAGNEQRARHAAERFLRARLRPIDRAALYALPGPGPQIDFTRDVDRLVAELPKIRGDLDRTGIGALGPIAVPDAYAIMRGDQLVLTRVAQRLSGEVSAADLPGVRPGLQRAGANTDQAMLEMAAKENARSIVARQDEAGRRFLTMLSDVVKALRGIEGRKSLILFSEGFYADNLSRELEQVAAAAAQSYVVTYAMDLNRRDVAMNESERPDVTQASEIQSRLEPLSSLAVETDGVLVPDATSQIDSMLSRISAQSQDYYIVGFEAGAEALKERGRYRRVTVRTTRDGARASTRTGYAMHDEPTPADRRRAIDTALRTPYPQQGIPIEYTTYVMKGQTPGSERVLLSVEADLPVAERSREAHADVVFVARSVRDGRVVASGTDRMRIPEAADRGRTTGKGRFRVQFDVPAGAYMMRVVVREPGGAVGSADRRILVRRLDAPSVTASDVVLGASAAALPVRADAYVGDGLAGAMEIYARSASALERVDVTATLVRIGDEQEVFSAHADLAGIKQTAGGASRPARIAMPLSGVTPGEYFLRVRVREQGETVAEMERDVRILAGEAPPAVAAAPADPSDAVHGELAKQLVSTLVVAPSLARAASLASAGKWDEVAAALPEAASPAREHLLLRGLLRLYQRAYAAAAADLTAALDAQPSDARIAFLLGWAQAGAGETAKSIGAWRSATYIDPALVPAHLALADAYLRVSQPALAQQALRAGLTALPNSPELIEKLAAIQR
jgi:VWFA-related protein